MQAEFATHPGPLIKGDLIVLEIGGRLLQRLPTDPRPQLFEVVADQEGAQSVSLKPIDTKPADPALARKYVCGWKP